MRFFNKTFFKFTLGFLVIVALSLVLIAAVSAYAEGIEKIVFTTEPQLARPGEISPGLTIQLQDSSGTAYKTTETVDLEFVSTSPTGEFLGSTGNPVSNVLSKNTANRTFYYRDATLGNFIITITATGRETLKSWTAKQNITISDSGDSEVGGEVLGASSDQEGSNNSSGSSLSGPVSTYTTSQLEVVAGGDRTTLPGSPITFQSSIKKNTAKASVELSWSFGDGNVGVGSVVTHTYKYPGNYSVVLNGRVGDTFAVSRQKVRVLDPKVSNVSTEDYIEIFNDGDIEINLFNWRAENEGKGFIFQPDTMVPPHSSVKFDKNLFRLKGYENSAGTVLKNNFGQVVATAVAPKVILNEIIPASLNVATPVASVSTTSIEDLTPTSISDTEIIYEAQKEDGIISKLTNLIKRVFSD